MKPAFLDAMSWEMAEVYGAITDQILINLAHYFPYYNARNFPRSSITYQADMLAQMGQVNKETMAIIRRNLVGCDKYLNAALEQVIVDSVQAVNPELWQAVKKGIYMPPTRPVLAPNQMQAFKLYYAQAANKLNLVNTVMLESTQQAYQATVSDIAARVRATQTALDVGAGEVVTGVSSWNTATAHAINRMKQNGITGFIDHAGHRWSAEAYVAMDIRTTMFNTARASVWETNQSFGNDLYSVSYHDGARPLCYPWQNKVISSTDNARTVVDLDGNAIQVYAQRGTTYGQPAGLFGINCKHYPTPFIPGVSLIRGTPQDEKENARTYAESQQQRAMERTIREQKRDLLMLKAQGAPDDVIKAQREKIRQTDDDIDAFCKQTGRARRQNRESVYTKREFPAANTYDVTAFTRQQQSYVNAFYQSGGAQTAYNNVQGMTPNVPLVPKAPTPPVQQAPATNFNYGKPFDETGYRSPQVKQLRDAKATLDAAPADARAAWEKVADDLKRPQLDPSDDGAYYSPGTKTTYYKTWKKCFEESTYQRKNAVFFHEYGHNIDNLIGIAQGGGARSYLSTSYVGANGKMFVQVLEQEIGDNMGAFYLRRNGYADAYDAVKAAQNGTGGMGFGAFTRQMLKGVMPGDEWRAIRDTLIDAGDDDGVLRPLVDKWLKPHFQRELRAIAGKDKGTADDLCEWAKKTFNIYERGDASDIYGNYLTRAFGRDFTHPFGIGHAYSYQKDASNMPIEAFAEMYSATVTQSDALNGIKAMLPESYKFFLEMLGSVTP